METITYSFGEFIQEKRLKKQMTLRSFCRQLCFDPSNWSKVERSIADPPKNKFTLKEIALLLDLSKDDEATLLELAFIGHLPIELLPSEMVLQKLPIFLKTLRGGKPTKSTLMKLIEAIAKS